VLQAPLAFITPEADYLNGAVLNVDGGWLAR
jgi:NAD(P)-dependent dehydrogenase (short-subunit alcohol dehydrogenase family)